jgi:hypothetical protein
MRSVSNQASIAAAVATVVVTKVEPASVEAVPTEPQQARTEHDKGQVVRSHRGVRPASALTEDQHQNQRRGTGIDVHRGAAREVDRGKLVGDPAAGLCGAAVEGEHPVCDREVHDGHPQCREQQPCAELDPVSDRTGDQRDGDDREHQLERDEHGGRHREDERNVHRLDGFDARGRIRDDLCGGVTADEALQPEELRRVAEEIGYVVAECQRVTVEHPQHRHHTHGAEAHHDHVEHALGPDHAPVEESQARGHQQDKRGARQHPRGITGIRYTEGRKSIHSQFPPSTRHGRNVLRHVDLVQDFAEWLFRLKRSGVSLV